jgi:hypothetical protein
MQNIPTGLQALMQASAVLQNTAAPTAPGPQGQQPTVANRVMQQGMAQAGKQAGIANAMMMQRAQRQQQMAQDPQAVAQMAAQMLKQGVGGLPVDMQFKEGGIIGFQEGGQPRFGTPEWEKRRKEEMERRGISNPLEVVGEYLRGLVPDKPLGSGVAEQRRQEFDAARQDPSVLLSPVIRDTVAPEQEQKPQAGAPVQGLPDVLPREIPSETGAQLGATPVKRDTAGSTPPSPPKEDGIAALQAQLAGLQGQRPKAPTIQDVISQAKGAVASPESGIERIRKISDERERAIEGMPNLEREGIAALEEAKAARKALLQKRREDDAYDTLRAFFRGLYTRGNEFDVARMGIKARDEQDALADLNHANSILKLKQAEQARQLGKFDRQEALEKEALSQMDKYSDNVAKSMQVTGTLLANVYNTDAQYVSQTLNRQAQQLIELAKLRQLYGQQEDTRQVQRITTLQSQLTNATKSVNDEMQKKFGPLLSILSVAKPEDLNKPEMQTQIARYKTEFANAQERFNIPELERVLQSEMSRYTRVESNVLRFDKSGKPVQ